MRITSNQLASSTLLTQNNDIVSRIFLVDAEAEVEMYLFDDEDDVETNEKFLARIDDESEETNRQTLAKS